MVAAGTAALRSISCPGVLVAPIRDCTDTTTPMVTCTGRGWAVPVQVINRSAPARCSVVSTGELRGSGR